MAGVVENLYLSERRRQRLVVGALVLLLVGGGAMSRNQRELFSAVGSEAQAATAFTAVAPPLRRVIGNPAALFAAARLRLPRRALANVIPATEAEARESDLGAAVGPAESNFVAEPTLADPVGIAEAPELAFLEDQLEFVPLPVAGILGELVAPPHPEPVVAASVPEPSSWLMLILGFLGIGTCMRRSKIHATTQVQQA